jgi:hypothetical protein
MFSKAVIRSVICLVMAAFAPGIAQAASTIYDCKFATGTARDGNWIPTVLVLRHDTATGKVVVFDPIIKHFIGNPIDARLSEETSQRRTFTWVVDARNTPSERQSARMAYWLNYYVNGRPARMIAKPSGYDNEWTGDGTCVARQG